MLSGQVIEYFCSDRRVLAQRARADVSAPVPSAHADERGPYGGEYGARQNVGRVIAECVAVLAHLHAQAADLIVAGGIKQAGENSQHCGHEIHQMLPAGMTVESRNSAQSHRSSTLSLPLGKLAQEKTCHVGQITCICSSSQEFSPRRETGRGLFELDGDPHSRALSPSLSAHCRQRRPRGRRPNQSTAGHPSRRPVGAPQNNERSRGAA